MSGQGLTIWAEDIRGRSCAGCKLCCTLVPVRAPPVLDKAAGERCQFVGSKGCKVYARRPYPCATWKCRWLFDDMAADLRRPDHAGYCIDPALDTVLANNQPVEVLQVWVDPARRDAHRDPALRRYLVAMAAAHNVFCIIRWSSDDGMVLIPPAHTKEHEWLEISGTMNTAEQMTERFAKLGVEPVPWARP